MLDFLVYIGWGLLGGVVGYYLCRARQVIDQARFERQSRREYLRRGDWQDWY